MRGVEGGEGWQRGGQRGGSESEGGGAASAARAVTKSNKQGEKHSAELLINNKYERDTDRVACVS